MACKVESFAHAKAAAVRRERSERRIRTTSPKADLARHDTMKEADDKKLPVKKLLVKELSVKKTFKQ